MASEIRPVISLEAVKNGAKISLSHSTSINMTGTCLYHNVQAIGTSAEVIALPSDLSGIPSLIFFKNLDSANYVEIALDSGMSQVFAKLLFGQAMMMPPSTATFYARANTALVDLIVVATEA